MNQAEVLTRVGRALWGEEWRNAMAAALDVKPRTVRYWLSGRFVVSVGVCDELAGLIDRQLVALQVARVDAGAAADAARALAAVEQ